MNAALAAQRLDSWLWCARRFRTRAAAAAFIAAHGVKISKGGRTVRVTKPGHRLRAGDQLAFMLDERVVTLKVLGFAPRRGSPAQAVTLYEPVDLR